MYYKKTFSTIPFRCSFYGSIVFFLSSNIVNLKVGTTKYVYPILQSKTTVIPFSRSRKIILVPLDQILTYRTSHQDAIAEKVNKTVFLVYNKMVRKTFNLEPKVIRILVGFLINKRQVNQRYIVKQSTNTKKPIFLTTTFF